MSTHKRTYKLLLIHSSVVAAKSINAFLSQVGFLLFQTLNPKEGMKMAQRYNPNLIVIDMEVVCEKEKKLIKQLKHDPLTFSIPLLILTTFSNRHFISEYLHYNDIDLIGYPFFHQELLLRIERQLAISQSKQKLQNENRQLKTTLEARDKLYTIIAHDLRAPIGTIKMLNATISSQLQQIKNSYIVTLFKMIQETTEETFHLLENLLNWTQMQYGKTKVDAKRFDINHAIHQTISLFHVHLLQKEIAIQEPTKHPIEVYADEEMIKTVLRNLIFNAIKFTYPGGKIDVETIHFSEYILVSIQDTGKGISINDQKKIKKRHDYLTTYGTHNEKGYGFGLSISQEFVN